MRSRPACTPAGLAEAAALRMSMDTAWRSRTNSGDWSTAVAHEDASVRYLLVDEDDGDLGDDPNDAVRLTTEVTLGDAVRLYSVELRPEPGTGSQSAPGALRSNDDAFAAIDEDVRNDRWWSQYFAPALPAGATGWTVTSV